MSDRYLIDKALQMLKADKGYLDDARKGAPLGNSVVGSLLSLMYKAPRWATEGAVMEAIEEIGRGKRKAERKPHA